MFFQVDLDTCNSDGLCSHICPAKLIEMVDNQPSLVHKGEQACIRCGHCVAICPEEALSLEFLSSEDCLTIDHAGKLERIQVEQFLRSRRSIRTYRKKPIPKKLLEHVLQIASSAPTGSNRQPVKWLVIYEKSDVHHLGSLVVEWMRFVDSANPAMSEQYFMKHLVEAWDDGADRICRDAPHLIFAYTEKSVASGATDSHIALAYLELALAGFQLGSCWAGYVTMASNLWPALAEFLGLSHEYQIHGAVMLGYPKFEYKRIPPRKKADIRYR